MNFVLKVFLVFVCCLILPGLSSPSGEIPTKSTYCDASACQLPNCRCSSVKTPNNLPRDETPQFVLLTFDDAVTQLNMEFYRDFLYNRVRPDGCKLSATFFVSHEYTDYSKVNELYRKGHEIALHSISHEPNTNYWKTGTIAEMKSEFADQRLLMSKFAKIPATAMRGLRMPFLQMNGNNQFRMMQQNDIDYDLSWPTQEHINPGFWPYTLDYKSDQECFIGPCPDESIKGPWVIPMLMWTDLQGYPCSMVDGCPYTPTTEDDIYNWIMDNFYKNYATNKAPCGFYVHSAWFTANSNRTIAYKRFLDKLSSMPDVYFVCASELIEWMRTPIPLSSLNRNTVCSQPEQSSCTPKSCRLMKGDQERYMTVCGQCPTSYPWVGNPLGDDNPR